MAAEIAVELGGKLRGHDISCGADSVWRYDDTGEPTAGKPKRDCGYCGESGTAEGHDACLGTLPGVLNACCGHGIDREAYVVLADGARLAGSIALEWVRALEWEGKPGGPVWPSEDYMKEAAK